MAIEHLRHFDERRHGQQRAGDLPGHVGEQQEVRGESIERVKQAISGLPPLERETLILFEYEGLSVNEIAKIVGGDGEIVAARVETARQTLRTALSTYFS